MLAAILPPAEQLRAIPDRSVRDRRPEGPGSAGVSRAAMRE
jgi:hypothetical protein